MFEVQYSGENMSENKWQNKCMPVNLVYYNLAFMSGTKSLEMMYAGNVSN